MIQKLNFSRRSLTIIVFSLTCWTALAPSAEAKSVARHLKKAARVCLQLLRGQRPPTDAQLKVQIAGLLAELRQNADYEHVVIKSPLVIDYLKTLHSELLETILDNQEFPRSNSVLLRSVQLIDSYVVRAIANSGIEYGLLQKLGFLVSLQYQMLENPETKISVNAGRNPIMNKAGDVEAFLKENKFCFFTDSGQLIKYDFAKLRAPAVFIPSFMLPHPELLLWAKSVGFGFLRQITTSELLFETEFTPTAMFLRKFTREMNFTPTAAEQEFWARVSSEILSAHNRELDSRLLFLIFFMDDAQMSCEGLNHWLMAGHYKHQGYNLMRMHDDHFHQHYSDHLGERGADELMTELKNLVPKFQALCPNTKLERIEPSI